MILGFMLDNLIIWFSWISRLFRSLWKMINPVTYQIMRFSRIKILKSRTFKKSSKLIVNFMVSVPFLLRFKQCCGSVTFWYGSGSADPLLWLKDHDPAIFISDLPDGNKKSYFAYYFLKLDLMYIIFKMKSHKEVTKQ